MADFPLAVITDEFSQDFERACRAAAELGIPELEIRTAWDKNVLAMTLPEIRRLKSLADAYGRRIVCIASPVYKCTLPQGGTVDARYQHDAFRATFTFDEQARLLARALEIAERLEARLVRVFSFWRAIDPDRNFSQIIATLREGGRAAAKTGIALGLENEPACHFATGAEAGRAIRELDPDVFGIVWDPGNACVVGERPIPDGYRQLPAGRILHVHAKDCVTGLVSGEPAWCDIGAGQVGWRDQLATLAADGYAGSISLETHWEGPRGDKFAGTSICARSLQRLVAAT